MNSRLFAVIPAAGNSERMGKPKLVLPWKGKPLIRHLLETFHHKDITARVCVCRRSDEALHEIAGEAGADVICRFEDPPDMRTSVNSAINYIRDTYNPREWDGWMLCPADIPRLSVDSLETLIAAWNARPTNQPPQVLLPTFNGERGHPVVFSWSLTDAIADIPADKGLNWLVDNTDAVQHVPVREDGILLDVDTPDDYDALTQEDQT